MAWSEPLWHPEALLDAEEARAWYLERSPLAARGFLLTLEHALHVVVEAPERWPRVRHGCRSYVFPNRYPYTLIYIARSPIYVVAVAHQKRRPGYWAERL